MKSRDRNKFIKLPPFHPFKPIWFAEFAILLIFLCPANVSALTWLRNESIFLKDKCNNQFPKQCELETNIFYYLDGCICSPLISRPQLSAFILSLFLLGTVEIPSRLHRKQVRVCLNGDRSKNATKAFNKFRNYREHVPKALLQSKRLSDIVTELFKLVESVENKKLPLQTPSAYLTSNKSKEFFTKAASRIHFFLKVVNGNAVRSSPLRAVLAFVVILLSSTFSLLAALATADSCKVTIVFYQFLEFFSLSFLTVLGLIVFTGFHDYDQFRYMPLDIYPLSKDEKFIISLIAANTNIQLNGFSQETFATYAKLDDEGKVKGFVELHDSLLLFKDFENEENS